MDCPGGPNSTCARVQSQSDHQDTETSWSKIGRYTFQWRCFVDFRILCRRGSHSNKSNLPSAERTNLLKRTLEKSHRCPADTSGKPGKSASNCSGKRFATPFPLPLIMRARACPPK